jgi:hypothetical protein
MIRLESMQKQILPTTVDLLNTFNVYVRFQQIKIYNSILMFLFTHKIISNKK